MKPTPRSKAEWLASLPDSERRRFLNEMTPTQRALLPYDWNFWARESQQAPSSPDWTTWLVMVGRGWGKMLSLETAIPTPEGWTAMGALEIGDAVFDESGRVCHVVGIADGMAATGYRLRFSDGTWLDACAEHQWVTWVHADRKAYGRGAQRADGLPAEWPAWRSWAGRGGRGPAVRTTQEIVDTLTYGARLETNHSVPVAAPLDLPARILPIGPYTLGAWLGDGDSKAAVLTTADPDVLREIEAEGYRVKPLGRDGQTPRYLLGGQPSRRGARTGQFIGNDSLHTRLKQNGLLGHKHVPSVYVRASIAQRLALLQGLMDTDGFAGPNVEFCTTRRELADGVIELARSLGQKPRLIVGRARLYGRDCGQKFRVKWRATIPVFRLPRKLTRVPALGAQRMRSLQRMIVGVESIPAQPMRCITVDSKHQMYLAGEGMIPTHNTRTGAEWVRRSVETGTARRIALVNDTAADVRDVMIEGPDGLMAVCPPWNAPTYEITKRRLTWKNGAVAVAYAAEAPELLRGPQHDAAWCDELAKWKNLRKVDPHGGTAWDNLRFGLRMGERPRCVVTTTPRPVAALKLLLREPSTVVTRGALEENVANLAPDFVAKMEARYGGTRLGRQELGGELVEDTSGALWTLGAIDAARVAEEPPLRRIVVAIDPAATSDDEANETGIVVAGVAEDGHGYVLEDVTVRDKPAGWARAAVAAYRRWRADRIIGEGNNGGEMIEHVVRSVDPTVAYAMVTASRGKQTRAEPISALYEQGKVHHVGAFPTLEDQMTTWVPGLPSPDRMDALVWALTELMLGAQPARLEVW